MALYSKSVKLAYTEPMAFSGAGGLSKDSYVLVEVTAVTVSLGITKAKLKYSLYAKASKSRNVEASIQGNNNSISKKVTIKTSMSCILIMTDTVDCTNDIRVNVSAGITYSSSGILETYGITTAKNLLDIKYITFVTFGKLQTFPYSMNFGKEGEFVFSKEGSYRLEFYDSLNQKQYSLDVKGEKVHVTVPISVFEKAKMELTYCVISELNGNTVIAKSKEYIQITETICSLSLYAYRDSTELEPSRVSLTFTGESAGVSTGRTITVYAKETSKYIWGKIGTVSPKQVSFENVKLNVNLSIDYAWDIYGEIEDGYTKAESDKVRIYSKQYIIDVRTDGKGIAFGGTAGNENEMYCGFETFRANNIVPTDISGIANLIYPVGSVYIGVSDVNPNTLFGGSWEKLENRFLLGSGSEYSLGSIGGEKTHLLTADESGLPSHNHGLNRPWSDGSGSDSAYTQSSKRKKISLSTSTCSGKNAKVAHNNMPPYLAVNMWKRIS